MPELKLEDDLEGLSAEDLESLIEQDDGNAKLEVDDQNFVTPGIDELNEQSPPVKEEANSEEPGDEKDETPPAEEPEETTGELEEEPEPEIDYEAEYNRQNAILARQKLLEAEESEIPDAPRPKPQLTGEELYKRAAENTKLSPEEQTKYDSFKEYDEDQADVYKQSIINKKLLADMYAYNEEQRQSQEQQAAVTQAAEEKSWNDVIHANKNMTKWQKDPEEWDSVNSVFKVVSRSKGFGDLSKTEQIALVEKRYLAATGQTVTEAPTPKPKAAPNIDKKIADAEKVKPPSSLSSVASTTDDGKPGRIKVNNGTDGSDIQQLFDNADPNDPEAIDKIMSRMDL